MATWEDKSTFGRSYTNRTPHTWELSVGVVTVTVHRHIHWPPDVWLLTCGPLRFNNYSLTASDIDKAKAEAIGLVRARLQRCLDALLVDGG